jgi:hypothetical protein
MYPHERSLVKKLENKPFVLLGINTDPSLAHVKKVIAKEHITWPSWVDGTTRGPIDMMYDTGHWPTIYVLDAKGVIRFIDPDDLDQAVETLLKEMEPK